MTSRTSREWAEVFASASETRRAHYAGGDETGQILSSTSFLSALQDTPHKARVEHIIRLEAEAGDKPSLLYMINLLGLFFEHVYPAIDLDRKALAAAKAVLFDRIAFCKRAVAEGMFAQSYYGCMASQSLFQILLRDGPDSDADQRRALQNIVLFGQTFLRSGYVDQQFTKDVTDALEHYEPLHRLMSAMGKTSQD